MPRTTRRRRWRIEAAPTPRAPSTPGPAPVDASPVWYVPERSDTAAAVAATLGIPAENVVQVDSLREGDVAVIIKSELAPVG